MKLPVVCILNILGLIENNFALPASIDEFYQELHERMFISPSNREDSCQKIANRKVISYQEALDCYKSFPLTEAIRRGTLETLNRTLEFSVFKDIMTESPDPNIPSNKNTDSEMKAISSYEFGSEVEFQSFLTGYFNTFHDGHTRYGSSCFSRFYFEQPFPIYGIGKKVKILDNIEHPVSMMKEWSKLGVDISKYQGSRVLKIDKMEPFEYLNLYSNFYIGQSRDFSSRLSSGFTRMNLNGRDWTYNNGQFSYTTLVPLNPTVTYSLKTPDGEEHNVVVPYLVRNNLRFTDSRSYYSSYCQSNSSENNPSNRSDQFDPLDYRPIHQPSKHLVDVDNNSLFKGQALQAYKTVDSTGVLVLHNFKQNYDLFIEEVREAFKQFRNNRLTKLTLDLSNNRGGNICQAYDLLHALFPDAKQFPFDMRSTPLLRELSTHSGRNAIFDTNLYKDLNNQPYINNEIFHSVQEYKRGSITKAKFTPKFHISCPNSLSSVRVRSKYLSKDISIITNTICYSACAVLVNSLQLSKNVTTYAFGGDPSFRAPAASTIGGTVFTLDKLLSVLNRYQLDSHPDAPRPFPTRASFRFNLRESYSYSPHNLPLEFIFLPAHHHLPYTSTLMSHPMYIWEHVARGADDPSSSNQDSSDEIDNVSRDNSKRRKKRKVSRRD